MKETPRTPPNEAVVPMEAPAATEAPATKPFVRAAVAVVWWRDRVLVGTRSEGQAMAGCNEFPGGKLHDDET
ncbi:MAG: hypothetical protein ACRDD1_12585, partial [Planctomycetia bacterium]